MKESKLKDQKGFGTIEAVILIAIVIGLAVVFREYIMRFVDTVFEAIFRDADKLITDPAKTITGGS